MIGGRLLALREGAVIETGRTHEVLPNYLRDLFKKLANGHLAKEIDALMPWGYAAQKDGSNELVS